MKKKFKKYSKKTGKYKSKLEAKVAKTLPKGSKYEPLAIPYIQIKEYYPDFSIPSSKGTYYLEVKGWFRYEDRAKMIGVKEHNPDLDIRLYFASDNKLSARSKMRYSDWCKKYGFKYCIGSIPEEWQ